MRLTDGVIALPLLPLLIVLAAVDLGKLGLSGRAGAVGSGQPLPDHRDRLAGGLDHRGAAGARRTLSACGSGNSSWPPPRSGAGNARLMLVHILPNVASPIVVATTLSVGNMILLESVLSFLGLGIQPPLPSWGNMLTNAQELIWSAPLLAIYPGLLIFVTVIAFNFVGDGLQDALDPRAGPLAPLVTSPEAWWAKQPLQFGQERPDPVRGDTVMDHRSLAPGRHQPFLPQQRQMARQVGLVEAERLEHFPDGCLAIDKAAQDHQPVTAGERAEEGFRLRRTRLQRRRVEVGFRCLGCG